MKYLIGLLMLSPSLSWAAPFVCFSKSPLKASSATVHLNGNSDGGFGGGQWEMHYELARWNPSCDDKTKDAEIKRMAEFIVCAELERQGIRCSMKN